MSTGTSFYADTDGDGYGDPSTLHRSCDVPSGYVDNREDCDDTSADISPSDNDGDGYSGCDGDCDDTDPNLNKMIVIRMDTPHVTEIAMTPVSFSI